MNPKKSSIRWTQSVKGEEDFTKKIKYTDSTEFKLRCRLRWRPGESVLFDQMSLLFDFKFHKTCE